MSQEARTNLKRMLLFLYVSLVVHLYFVWFLSFAEKKGLLDYLTPISKTLPKKELVIENIIVDTVNNTGLMPEKGKISDKINPDTGPKGLQEIYNYKNLNPGKKALPQTRLPVNPIQTKSVNPDGVLDMPSKKQNNPDAGDPHTMFYEPDNPPVVEMNSDGEISLGTVSADYASYFIKLEKEIGQSWQSFFPVFQHYQGILKDGTVTVHFNINPSGAISDIYLVQSYGYDVLDESCVNAVHYANTVGPLPDSLKKEGKISVNFKFLYLRKN